MTTLSEFGQVSEYRLIHALQAQCAVVDSNQANLQGLVLNRPRTTS